MTKTEDKGTGVGRFVARGATYLFLSQIASKVVGIVGSIVLVRLLVSPSVYGYISVATTIPGLVMLGNITGANVGLTKYLAEYKVQKNSEGIWSCFWVAMFLKVLTGVALSLVAYVAAGPVSVLIGKPATASYFAIAAWLPFVWVTQISVKSTLLSLDSALAYSLLQVLNEVFLSFLPIAAVLLGYGAVGALSAMVIGNYAYLVIALIISTATVFAETEKGKRRIPFVPTLKKLVYFGLPLGFSNSFVTFAGQAVNLVVARFVDIGTYGLYGVAQSASAFLSYVSDPVTTMLLPAYSRVSGSNDTGALKRISDQTARFSTMITLPIVIFFVVFAKPFISLLFGSEYSGAGIMLTIISLGSLTIGLGIDPISSFLTSRGFTAFSGGLSILVSCVGVAIAVVCLPTVGLMGYLLANVFAFIPGYLFLLRKAKSALNLSPPLQLVKSLYAAALATGIVCLPLVLLNIPPLGSLILGLLAVPILYVVFAAWFRALGPSDTAHLSELLATQPTVSLFARPLLSFFGSIMKLVQNHLRKAAG